MIHGYWQQPPTDDQHSVGHLASAAVNNQVDDKHKTKKTGNDERSRNDLAPCLSVTSTKGEARIRSRHLFYQRLLSIPIAHSRVEIDRRSYAG